MHIEARGAELKRHMDALSSLDGKLRQYVFNHSARETVGFGRKTIKDFVSMGILSCEDEVYIQKHQIKFYGYDPTRGDKKISVFEEALDTTLNHVRLTLYSDGSADTEESPKK